MCGDIGDSPVPVSLSDFRHFDWEVGFATVF